MASRYCPGCDEKLDGETTVCPRCGYKKDPLFARKLTWFTVIFVVLGVLWLLFLTKGEWS